MIIECINCNKKFEVDSKLIPPAGRAIQCGSCNHTWFYKLLENKQISNNITNKKKDNISKKEGEYFNKDVDKIINTKDNALVKYQKKNQFNLSKFLSYTIVLIISFICLLVIIDTFKSYLYNLFPNLEFLIFSFFETLKDINLFIKDLI